MTTTYTITLDNIDFYVSGYIEDRRVYIDDIKLSEDDFAPDLSDFLSDGVIESIQEKFYLQNYEVKDNWQDSDAEYRMGK